MIVRDAKDTDRSALLEMVLQLNHYEDRIAHNRRLDEAGARDTQDETMARIAETGGAMLIAEEDGAVLGYLALTFERRGAWVREGVRDYGYVRELLVRDEARGRGVGQELLVEAEARTRARSLNVMMVGVLTGNELAERAYARAGYRPFSLELIKTLDDEAPDPAAGKTQDLSS